jgi:hypothetical protein
MAQQIVQTQPAGPTTEEGFLADRQSFWSSFTKFVLYAVIVVALIIIGLAVFLV